MLRKNILADNFPGEYAVSAYSDLCERKELQPIGTAIYQSAAAMEKGGEQAVSELSDICRRQG